MVASSIPAAATNTGMDDRLRAAHSQLSFLLSVGREMTTGTTGQSAVMLCGWRV